MDEQLVDRRINELRTLIARIRDGLNDVITQTTSLVNTIDQSSTNIQGVINRLNILNQTFTRVKNSIELAKGKYAIIWLYLSYNMDFRNIRNSTDPEKFKTYKNTEYRVNEGVPILTQYPKLKNMVAVLRDLKTASNQQAANERAARNQQAANERAARNQQAARERAARNQEAREQVARNRQTREEEIRRQLVSELLPRLRELQSTARRVQMNEQLNNNPNS
jgi:hypothetical protein